MAEHTTPTSRAAGDEILSADINQFIRWLTGIFAYPIVLSADGSDGPAITFTPETNQADGTKLFRLTKADGSTERFALTNDGQVQLYGQLGMAKGADIASAAALNLGTDGNTFHVTGTTTITSIESRTAGFLLILVFDGSITVTHNATTLILDGATNFAAAAGDVLVLVSEGSGNWREVARKGETATHVYVKKAAAETVNNSSTLQDDADFTFPIAANETWIVDLWLQITASNDTADSKWTFTLPAGASMLMTVMGFPTANMSSGGSAPGMQQGTTPGTAITMSWPNTITLNAIHIKAILINAGTGGQATLQWAQATAQANDLTVAANSFMVAHRVS